VATDAPDKPDRIYSPEEADVYFGDLLRVISSRAFVETAKSQFYGQARLTSEHRHAPAFMRDIISDKAKRKKREEGKSARASARDPLADSTRLSTRINQESRIAIPRARSSEIAARPIVKVYARQLIVYRFLRKRDSRIGQFSARSFRTPLLSLI